MTDQECMVTVMCTAYNHEKFLRQCLDGIVNQKTNFRFELLVNDDVSTDSTAEIIREYEENYPDIVRAFYQEKNLYQQGIDVYYSHFFPNAKGKYCAICEGDDYWTDDTKLQRQFDFMEANPDYSACVHNTLLKYCGGDKKDEELVKRTEDCDVGFESALPGMNTAWHTSSIFAKTAILASPPDYYYPAIEHGFSDYPYGLWLLQNGPVHFLARTMSVYRINSNQDAWSSGVDGQYDKLVNFMTGAIEMLNLFRVHVTDEKLLTLTDNAIRGWEFQLLYTQGRDEELRKEPYRAILKTRPLKFRVNNLIKVRFPRLHKYYRKRRGYGD